MTASLLNAMFGIKYTVHYIYSSITILLLQGDMCNNVNVLENTCTQGGDIGRWYLGKYMTGGM
jgi:hypothetical protein